MYTYVVQNPWTAFDPDGLKSKKNYRDDQKKAKQEYKNKVKKLREQRKSGELSREGYRNAQRRAVRVRNGKIRAAKNAMAKIDQTARDISELTGQSVNAEYLDDEDQSYKDFRKIIGTVRWIPGSNTAEEVVKGNKAEAAKAFATEVALTYLGGKVLQRMSTAARGTTKNPSLPANRLDLHKDLRSKGFEYQKTSPGGNTIYRGPDGKTVTVKPSGEVIPTQRVWNKGRTRKYPERQDYGGNRIPDQSHSTGHFVEPLDSL